MSILTDVVSPPGGDYTELLKSRHLSDISIIISASEAEDATKGTTFDLHRTLISTHSPILASAVTDAIEANKDHVSATPLAIHLPGFTVPQFVTAVKYMYSGKYGLPGRPVDINILLDDFHTAHELQMPGMQDAIMSALLEAIKHDHSEPRGDGERLITHDYQKICLALKNWLLPVELGTLLVKSWEAARDRRSIGSRLVVLKKGCGVEVMFGGEEDVKRHGGGWLSVGGGFWVEGEAVDERLCGACGKEKWEGQGFAPIEEAAKEEGGDENAGVGKGRPRRVHRHSGHGEENGWSHIGHHNRSGGHVDYTSGNHNHTY